MNADHLALGALRPGEQTEARAWDPHPPAAGATREPPTPDLRLLPAGAEPTPSSEASSDDTMEAPAPLLLVNATFEEPAVNDGPDGADRLLTPGPVAPSRGTTPGADTGADDSRLLRLLGFVGGGELAVLIDVVDANAWPFLVPRVDVTEGVQSGQLRPVPVRLGDLRCVTEADLDPATAADADDATRRVKLRAQLDRRWEVIAPLASDLERLLCGEVGAETQIRTRAAELRASPTHTRTWLRRYWQRGQTRYALLPDYHRCGAPDVARFPADATGARKMGRPTKAAAVGHVGPVAEGVVVDAATREKLRAGFRFIKAGMRAAEAYLETKKAYFYEVVVRNGQRDRLPAPGAVYPTYGQWLHHTRDLRTPEVVERAKHGRAFVRKRRARLGTAAGMAYGPGSIYQVDGTVADAYILSRNRKQVIGRPTAYVTVDAFSGMYTGLSVTLGYAGWQELSTALMIAFSDKVAYCARFGITITEAEWPCVGVPERLLGDRGEPVRKSGNHAVVAFQMALDTTPPWRADWKGLVENKIKFMGLDAARWRPGWVEKTAHERGQPDYRRSAAYTLDEFTAVMIHRILWHNNHRPRTGVALPEDYPIDRGTPTPRDLWNWGLRHRTGRLKTFPKETLLANLLPAKECTANRHGLRYSDDLVYAYASGERAGLFIGGPHLRPQVIVAVDPRRVGTAYVRHPDGTFEPARLVGQSTAFDDWSLDEVVDYRTRLKVGDRLSAPEHEAGRAPHDAAAAAITARAIRAAAEVAEATEERRVKTDEMKAERRDEHRARSAELAAADVRARATHPVPHAPEGMPAVGTPAPNPPRPQDEPTGRAPSQATTPVVHADHRALLKAALGDD